MQVDLGVACMLLQRVPLYSAAVQCSAPSGSDHSDYKIKCLPSQFANAAN